MKLVFGISRDLAEVPVDSQKPARPGVGNHVAYTDHFKKRAKIPLAGSKRFFGVAARFRLLT